jgi:hypothetical protein
VNRDTIIYEDADDNESRLVVNRFTNGPLTQVQVKNGRHMVLNKPQLMELHRALGDRLDEIEAAGG